MGKFWGYYVFVTFASLYKRSVVVLAYFLCLQLQWLLLVTANSIVAGYLPWLLVNIQKSIDSCRYARMQWDGTCPLEPGEYKVKFLIRIRTFDASTGNLFYFPLLG